MRFLADQNFLRTCKKLMEEFGHSLWEPKFDPNTGLRDDWLIGLSPAKTMPVLDAGVIVQAWL
jgi:hypothetical protein